MPKPNSCFKWELDMKCYLRQIYRRGYPSTTSSLEDFNKRFLESSNLSKDKNAYLEIIVEEFHTKYIEKNIMPDYIKGDRNLEKMFEEVVHNYKKPWSPSSPIRCATSSPLSNYSTASPQKNNNDAQNKIETLEKQLEEKMRELKEKEKQLEEFQDAQAKDDAYRSLKINEMKKKNKEMNKNLAEKEEQLQQMKERMQKMNERRKKTKLVKRSLEDKAYSLEETITQKDQMLTTWLKVHDTLLHSLNMSQNISSLEWQPFMKKYVHQLYWRGYPSTNSRLKMFNKSFVNDSQLSRDTIVYLERILDEFHSKYIQEDILPVYFKGDRNLEKLFDEVVHSYQKTWRPSPVRRSVITSSPPNNFTVSLQENNAVQENIEILKNKLNEKMRELKEKEKQLEELQDAQAKEDARHLMKINEMKNKNKEMTKNLAEKEQQLQQMEEKMQKIKESRKKAKLAKRSMKEKAYSLEEAITQKDQMLATWLKVHDTLLHSLINK